MSKWPYSTQRWQRVRALKLRVSPICEGACLHFGIVEPATAVDHKKPISEGGDPFPPLDQLTSLCTSCHSMKTNSEQVGEDFMKRGCDIYGKPLAE